MVFRAFCLLLLPGLLLAGCATSVRCPQQPDDPRPAFVLGHGRHTTLVLSDGTESLWRYGYGDWRYYAEAETGFWPGFWALMWPTPAALARQEYPGVPPLRRELLQAVQVGVGDVHQLQVAGNLVDELRDSLDRAFERGSRKRRLANDRYDFVFVHHPRDYGFWHNSNHMVATWLEALGCQIRGNPGGSIDTVLPP